VRGDLFDLSGFSLLRIGALRARSLNTAVGALALQGAGLKVFSIEISCIAK